MPEFKWWYVLVNTVAVWPLFFGWVLFFPEADSNIHLALLFSPMIIFGLGSFVAIHHDSKQLRNDDAAWQPSTKLWLLANWFLTPWFTPALYLTFRFVRLRD